MGRFLVLELTESRVQHVECHPITLLCSRNRHQSLVTVILRFVNLDDATADLSDFINLLAAFANYGADHVVRDENLLC